MWSSVRRFNLTSRLALIALSCLSTTAASANANLLGVDVKTESGRVDVILHGSEPLTFQSWSKAKPAAVVVELFNTSAATQAITETRGALKLVRVQTDTKRNNTMTRVTLELNGRSDFDVTGSGNDVRISLYGDKLAVDTRGAVANNPPIAVAMSTPMRTDNGIYAEGPPVEGSAGRVTGDLFAQAGDGPRQMSYIGFRNSATDSRIFARLNAEAKFTVRKEGDNLVVLEIQNATIPLRNNKNHLDTTHFDSPVKMITPSEVEDATPTIRITIEMKSAVPYEAKLEGRDVVLMFKK